MHRYLRSCCCPGRCKRRRSRCSPRTSSSTTRPSAPAACKPTRTSPETGRLRCSRTLMKRSTSLFGQGDYSGLAWLWPRPGSRRVGLGRRASAGGRGAGGGRAAAALRHLARRHAAGAHRQPNSRPHGMDFSHVRCGFKADRSHWISTEAANLNQAEAEPACLGVRGRRRGRRRSTACGSTTPSATLPSGSWRARALSASGDQPPPADRLPTALIGRLLLACLVARLLTSFLAGLRG